ncbi:hypothetical protein [Qipengyuania atrilutea]|uniref:ABC transporter n=1 Tax=Qipengyuania atrilutea TaxID=2744473 RepID=A0A850H7S8_9SPHN|nr:hypothetical protein [Actirhodobacter atriluteus]NVD45898.1 hypothetical protein [Actirhodobacter atriluteus]
MTTSLGGCSSDVRPSDERDFQADAAIESDLPKLGLVTGLPIYWPEEAGFEDLAQGESELPWVRKDLEKRFAIVPLDRLAQGDGSPSAELSSLQHLMIAQPRGLSAAANVALDSWVRNGGELLYVIDPMLTQHSQYGLGDPRRPNDVGLVPPFFVRWGLSMSVPENPDGNPSTFRLDNAKIVALEYGELQLQTGEALGTHCELLADGLVAQCDVGEGQALIIADASFLEPDQEPVYDRPALTALLNRAFGAQ